MPSCARCRSRTARVSRSIVSSALARWDGRRWRGGRAAQFKSSDPAQTGNEYTRPARLSSRRDVANSDNKLWSLYWSLAVATGCNRWQMRRQ
jgi:hypothetical protein